MKDEDKWLLKILKEDINKLNPDLRSCLQLDYLLLRGLGIYSINIFALDANLAKLDPEFDPTMCKYKGKSEISTAEYVKIKYGADQLALVKKLMKIENIK